MVPFTNRIPLIGHKWWVYLKLKLSTVNLNLNQKMIIIVQTQNQFNEGKGFFQI